MTAGIEHQRHQAAPNQQREQNSSNDREISVKRYWLTTDACPSRSGEPDRQRQQREQRSSHEKSAHSTLYKEARLFVIAPRRHSRLFGLGFCWGPRSAKARHACLSLSGVSSAASVGGTGCSSNGAPRRNVDHRAATSLQAQPRVRELRGAIYTARTMRTFAAEPCAFSQAWHGNNGKFEQNCVTELSEGVTEAWSDTAANAVTYSYRATVLGAPRHFTLSEDGIDWTSGVMSGHIPYRDISRLRLSFRPVSMQSHRFITELWGEGAPRLKIVSTSWKSMVEQERLDRSYSDFVRELHRRIARAMSPTRFERGTSPLIYWPSLAIFVAVALGLAGGAVQALHAGATPVPRSLVLSSRSISGRSKTSCGA